MAERTRGEPRHRATTSSKRRHLARIHPGTLPGTLPETEPSAAGGKRVHVIAYGHDFVTESDGATVEEALAGAPAGVRWINIEVPDAALLRELAERFKLHSLALEDVLTAPQRPKVERYTDHYFMILRMLRCVDQAHAEVDAEQVGIFFGHDWVITLQERADGDVFDPVRQAIRQRRGRVRETGADYLAYLIVDAVVDALYPVLEAVSDRVEDLESETLRAMPRTLQALQHTRHS